MIALRRTSTVSIDKLLPQAERAALIAQAARQERDDLVRAGRAPANWRTFVDGRAGAAEETIRPGGTILYRFDLIGEAAIFALAFCVARSPERSGDYRKAWFVSVDGRRWTGDLADIPATSEVFISNDMPYHRKIDVGGMRMSVPPQIIEDARKAVRRKFPTLSPQRTFITWPGAYELRSRGRRKDRTTGQVMTYPALVLNQRQANA